MKSEDLLRYGIIHYDDEWIDIRCNFIRNRIIELDGKIYVHEMINGEVVEIREIDIDEIINKINKGGN